MAERIDSLPERGAGGEIRAEWFEGAWMLTQGEDYQRSTRAMRAALASAGRTRGLRMRSRVVKGGDGEGLAVEFLPRDGAERKADRTANKQTAPARTVNAK